MGGRYIVSWHHQKKKLRQAHSGQEEEEDRQHRVCLCEKCYVPNNGILMAELTMHVNHPEGEALWANYIET